MTDVLAATDTTTTTPTYAELWADAINETYDSDEVECIVIDMYRGNGGTPEDYQYWDYRAAVHSVLDKAADALRNGATVTFTGSELDLVRHLMPAHEVHQSGAKRWVLDNYGEASE